MWHKGIETTINGMQKFCSRKKSLTWYGCKSYSCHFYSQTVVEKQKGTGGIPNFSARSTNSAWNVCFNLSSCWFFKGIISYEIKRADSKVCRMDQKNCNPWTGVIFCQNAIPQVTRREIWRIATAAYHYKNGGSYVASKCAMYFCLKLLFISPFSFKLYQKSDTTLPYICLKSKLWNWVVAYRF